MTSTMRLLFISAGAIGVAAMASGCQSIPKEMTVMEYCADAKNANKDVCKINVELDGQKRALADTNMSLSRARAIADEALTTANSAKATAEQALAREDDVYCETRTFNRVNIGTCSSGYKVVSCTQTRYTKRAGGPSIMREINDEQCRFNDKVLEIQVRCCHAGSAARPLEAVNSTTAPSEPASSPVT